MLNKYKCKICNNNFASMEEICLHIERNHISQLPTNWTASRYYYKMKTGKSSGQCVMCKKETEWNEGTYKYKRFCSNPKCKERYVEEFRKRMIGKHGKINLLNDPEQQKKMLANRKISGKYKWSDGSGVTTYTGSYELDLLRVLDVVFGFSADDIIAPSPHTYHYLYDGRERFYIPDFFIPSLNLEIEVKDGGDNPNNHHKIKDVDKKKEELKDNVMTSQKAFSYIKIIDKKYHNLFHFLTETKANLAEGNKEKQIFLL